MESHLPYKRREQILNMLTKDSLIVLRKYHKNMLSSVFQTSLFEKDFEWDFYDYIEDINYNTPLSMNLKCDACGHNLKKQYILQSKKTNELTKLGITCFSNLTGINSEIAKEVNKQLNVIDKWLDYILINTVEYNFRNYIKYYQIISEYTAQESNSIFSKYELTLIHDFFEANLHLPHTIVDKVEKNLRNKIRKVIDDINSSDVDNKLKSEVITVSNQIISEFSTNSTIFSIDLNKYHNLLFPENHTVTAIEKKNVYSLIQDYITDNSNYLTSILNDKIYRH